LVCFFGEPGFVERTIHQFDPAVTGLSANRERGVAYTKARMAPLPDICRRSAESKNEKIPQTLFSGLQIVRGIQLSQHFVTGDLPVKSRNEPGETVASDRRIDLCFRH